MIRIGALSSRTDLLGRLPTRCAVVAVLLALTVPAKTRAQPTEPAKPGARASRPLKRGGPPPASNEPKTVEYKQFQVLLQYPDSGSKPELHRRIALAKLGVAEDLTSAESIRRGAQRYVRQRWRAVRAARVRDTGLVSQAELIKAWRSHARDETQLYADAIERIGLELADVRPAASGANRVRAELRKHAARSEVLLRALLGGADGARADRIVRYAGRLENKAARVLPAYQAYLHWEWVCLSPDPDILPALLRYACLDESRDQVESLLHWTFRAVLAGRWSLSEKQMRTLIGCADERALAASLEQLGGGLENHMPFLKDLIFDSQLRPGVQLALILSSARRPNVVKTVFGSDNAVWREALLRAYLRPGAGPPRELDLEQLVVADDASPIEQELAVQLLGKRARRSPASRRAARETLRGFTEADDPALRQLAAEMIAQIERWDAEQAENTARRAAEQLATLDRYREALAAADRGEIELDRTARELLTFLTTGSQAPRTILGLDSLWDALNRFASDNNGFWPESLASIEQHLPRVGGPEYLYFPLPSVPIDRATRNVILAVAAEPVQMRATKDDPGKRVLAVLFTFGEIMGVEASDFPDRWTASNAARAALGEAEIPASALGDLAGWAAEGASPIQP